MGIEKARTLLTVAVILSVPACSDSGPDYPEQVRTNFLTACKERVEGLEDGDAACQCLLEKVEEKMTLQELAEVERTRDMDDWRLQSAVNECN